MMLNRASDRLCTFLASAFMYGRPFDRNRFGNLSYGTRFNAIPEGPSDALVPLAIIGGPTSGNLF
jgi:hypothetical protein